MELRQFLTVLLRNWTIVLGAVLVGILAASVHVISSKSEYQSTARIYVSVQAAASVADLGQANVYAQQIVGTYAELATTPYVLRRAVEDANLAISADELGGLVSASASGDTSLLNVTATASSPVLATDSANAVTRSLIASVQDLAPATSSANASLKITEVQAATSPAIRLGNSPSSELLVGALLGAVLGVIGVLVRDRANVRVRATGDVESITEVPVIGRIPLDSHARSHPLAIDYGASADRTEAFRSLRAALQAAGGFGGGRRIVVSSSIPREGKSTTTANLAVALAKAGESVVVVDTDLRRPALAAMFGFESSPGVSDVLAGSVGIDDVVHRWGGVPVDVIGAGTPVSDPSELVQSAAMAEMLEALSRRYSTVLLDSPPLLPVSDAAVLGARCSGMLLVVALEKARTRDVARSLEFVQQFGVHPLGVVATMVRHGGPDGVYRGYSSYVAMR